MSDSMKLIKDLHDNFDSLASYPDDFLITLFEHFADKVDDEIQNELFTELMVKYIEVSKKLKESNKKLQKYSAHLEEMVKDKVKDITASQVAVIHALVKLSESRDDDTGAHIERTSEYCRVIAENIMQTGYYDNQINDVYAAIIEKASPLHDIGKVGIADSILLKPGRLTGSEFDIMKTHVLNGYETLACVEKLYPSNKFVKIGMEISRYHHEKWDGSGYMYGLSGERIPLSARIMALSDVYDALRARRVYKEPLPHNETIEIIARGRGTHFDPVLTDIFLDNHDKFGEIYDRLTTTSR
ncbi:MAG: HD domain-containing protein [Oscillospiraceae bacterium]|nr:HD domain-containing protein [Oscillospiraceae bacterium]